MPYELPGILIAIILVLGVSTIIGVQQCRVKAEAMQVNYQYDLVGGCMIEDKGRFIPLNNFRAF